VFPVDSNNWYQSQGDEDRRESVQGEGSGVSAVERIMATPDAVEILQLTRANYHKWALVMKVSMEALELLDADEAKCNERARIGARWRRSSAACRRR
jgi:hypothetical protein